MSMIFHKYIPTIHFHPILLIFIIISFLTGTFMELSIILLIVLIHELGHFFMAVFLKWRVDSIMLWVFGGVMKTEEHGNSSLSKEALVIIAGPVQNLMIYLGLYFLSTYSIFPSSVLDLVFYYNTAILLFNLLPIWPLDGGKLLFVFLSSYLPYRKAYHSVIIFSMIISLVFLLLQLFVFPFTLSAFCLMIFLFMENRTEWKQRFFVFIRFLLSRYEGNSYVKKVQPITVSHQNSLMDVFSQFKKGKKHPVYIYYPNHERKFIDESDCLRSYFHDQQYNKTIGEVADKVSL